MLFRSRMEVRSDNTYMAEKALEALHRGDGSKSQAGPAQQYRTEIEYFVVLLQLKPVSATVLTMSPLTSW